MVVQALLIGAPLAIDLLNVMVTAQENERKYRLSLIHSQLIADRLQIEREEIDFKKSILISKVKLVENFLGILEKSYDTKVDIFRIILLAALNDYASEKELINFYRENLHATIFDPSTPAERLVAANRESARLDQRLRNIERSHAKSMRQIRETLVALSPADFSQVGELHGLI